MIATVGPRRNRMEKRPDFRRASALASAVVRSRRSGDLPLIIWASDSGRQFFFTTKIWRSIDARLGETDVRNPKVWFFFNVDHKLWLRYSLRGIDFLVGPSAQSVRD
jgi:hypothetical protein